MNIAHRYGVGYWKTACLNINSGMEGDIVKGTDFKEVSRAVNDMKDSIIKPDINKSNLKFTTSEHKTLFGLKAISGLDVKTLDAILEHRPFSSLEDYHKRMVETKLISPKKTITLIKSGAMDNILNKNRRLIMAEFVKLVVPEKEKITLTQINYVREFIPAEFTALVDIYDFRSKIMGRNKIPMNKDIENEFINKYAKQVDYSFDNGTLVVDTKSFEKLYNKEIKPLKEELKKKEYAREFTKKKRFEYWNEKCLGTVEDWEVETILYNTNNFAIDVDKVKTTHSVSEFNELPNKPVKTVNKRGFQEFHLSAITGITIGYDHQKKLVYLLTKKSGVITIKLNKNTYAKYHEKTSESDSWWNKGNKLVLIGYKDGYAFRVKGDRVFTHPVIQIKEYNNKYYYNNQK